MTENGKIFGSLCQNAYVLTKCRTNHFNDIRICIYNVALHNSLTDFLWCCILRYIIITSDCLLPLAQPARHMWFLAFAGHSTTARSQIEPFSINRTPPDAILQGPNLMNNLAGVLMRFRSKRRHTVATWGNWSTRKHDGHEATIFWRSVKNTGVK